MPCHCPQLMIFCELPVSYHLPAPYLSLSSTNKTGTSCLGALYCSFSVLFFIIHGTWPEVGLQTFCMCRGLPQVLFGGRTQTKRTL